MSKQHPNLSIAAASLVIFLAFPTAGTAQGGSCTDQVPPLEGDSPAVSRSGIFSSTYPAWHVFDSQVTGVSSWLSETFETPAWISYDFGVSTAIHRYQINHLNGPLTSRAPKDFTLQGWNGSSWNILDSRDNETNWTSGSPRSYDVASPGRYSLYRLHITDDNDVRSGVVVISISDLQLLACTDVFADGFESGDTSAWSFSVP